MTHPKSSVVNVHRQHVVVAKRTQRGVQYQYQKTTNAPALTKKSLSSLGQTNGHINTPQALSQLEYSGIEVGSPLEVGTSGPMKKKKTMVSYVYCPALRI